MSPTKMSSHYAPRFTYCKVLDEGRGNIFIWQEDGNFYREMGSKRQGLSFLKATFLKKNVMQKNCWVNT